MTSTPVIGSESRWREVARHEWDGDCSLGVTIVEGVAAALDCAHHDLTPLARVVDPEAVESVLSPRSGDASPDGRRTVSFRYEGHDVVVTDDGRVVLRDE